jgi:lipoprotein signal peptidase
MIKPLKIIPFLIIILFILPTISLAGQFKVTRVYDGDTIKAEGHHITIKIIKNKGVRFSFFTLINRKRGRRLQNYFLKCAITGLKRF